MVTEKGEFIEPGEMRDKVFRVADRDEPSGYVVRNMEDEGAAKNLCYLQEK